MPHLVRALRAPLLACALAALAPAVAAAAPTISSLRVEAGGKALSPGTSYVHDTARIRTSTVSACGGSGKTVTVPGPTALGLVEYARRAEGRPLSPFRVSDKFDFGLFVCGIGDFVGDDERFWLYKVNHVAPEVGGGQFTTKRGDEVLWYFSDTRNNVNTGDELVLSAPARSRSGRTFTVRVLAFDAQGQSQPAAGVRIRGGGGAVTGPDGRARILARGRMTAVLRGTRGSDIPSEPKAVCISPDLRECPSRRGETIVGTSSGDRIRGTRGADAVAARGGRDRIDVRGGGRDAVTCGRGFDTVRADRSDRIARNCERVLGAGLGGSPRFTG